MGFVNRLITWIMDRLSVEVDPDAEWFWQIVKRMVAVHPRSLD